ncbi:hypothetical protein GGQ18_002869 [Salinibacter ruber]|uniref:hypothetical protein n=1 Tax=Salinibacter ruber TaxID=146919 RepID=UPI0016132A66|nr:hypothetical protein [Salinibacter ruber]MBB4070261.1 hypothetical protein [Salinibacter ruber]
MGELTVFTITSEGYIPGVVALVDSLRAHGFDGPICIGAMDAASEALHGSGVRTTRLDEPEGTFSSNLKPKLLLSQNCEKFLFLDADIVVSHDRFTERIADWVDTAPVFAVEGLIAPTDYRRHVWERLAGEQDRRERCIYYNAGMFAGILQRERSLLRRWKRLNETVLDPADRHFDNEDFRLPDQDTLNAILQERSHREIISLQPPDWRSEAIPHSPFLHVGGFRGEAAFLHCTTSEKPWLLDTIPPRQPNPYERAWIDHVDGGSTPISHEVSLPFGVRRWLSENMDGRIAVKFKQLRNRFT